MQDSINTILVERMTVEEALHHCFSSNVKAQLLVLEGVDEATFHNGITFYLEVPMLVAKEALASYKGKVKVTINNA